MKNLKPESIMKEFWLINPCVEDEAEINAWVFVPTQEQGGEGLQVRAYYSSTDYDWGGYKWLSVEDGRALYKKLVKEGWKPSATSVFSKRGR